VAAAPEPRVLLVAALAVLVGAAVQGAAGFGLGLLAAPVLALADPGLVPVSMLVVTAVLPLLTLARERTGVDWRGVGWAMVGRLPGTALGAWAVLVLPVRAIGAAVALAVLLGVAASTTRWRPRPTRGALVVAGAVSGAAGTATSIGGPPVALLYQDEPGPRVRVTLAAFFFAGIVVSLAVLGATGQVGVGEVVAGVLLLPAMGVGFLLSGPLRRVVDAGRTRPVVLTLAGASAAVLLVRSLLG
jgi:hypothetical protein